MRGRDKRSQGSAEPNDPCRLTMRPHHDSVPSRAHSEYRIRLYDRDRVVGYVPVPTVLLMIAISAALWALIYLLIHLLTRGYAASF